MEETALLGGRLIVRTGDITRMETDAVVNAANSGLMGGGGVDGAIHRAGGPSVLRECRQLRADRYPDGLPAGQAAVTGAGDMPSRYVIHTVGPVWHGGTRGEPATLAGCYRSSLEEAARLGLSTVAFPAISTGVYGYPKEKAARVAFDAVREFLEDHELPRTVYFVFFSPADAALFLESAQDPTQGSD
ncbi:MAG: O-acetyl-ADP-ribose deacetylase [Spirochaetales bacterium]|nr:O-acetyl-ADP-ribose deacetylase [Spirochaetales bacterium]